MDKTTVGYTLYDILADITDDEESNAGLIDLLAKAVLAVLEDEMAADDGKPDATMVAAQRLAEAMGGGQTW